MSDKKLRQDLTFLDKQWRGNFVCILKQIICSVIKSRKISETLLKYTKKLDQCLQLLCTAENATKQDFRSYIWDYMMKNRLVHFPLLLNNRIPNFDGSAEAAQKLSELEVFKKAKIVKINLDKPQEPVRFLCLEANKDIVVPSSKLKFGHFQHIIPPSGASKEELKNAAMRRGVEQWGNPIGLDSMMKVDLVVLGSVCVSPKGYRIGKGEGSADLEFAMMLEIGAINEDTVVVTTVHDCQIMDDLPEELFKQHDVPVDIIITPTQTIIVDPKLKKPPGIIWNIISQRTLKVMQILKQLKEEQEKSGKVIVLKEVDSYKETKKDERDRRMNFQRHTKSNPNRSKQRQNFGPPTGEDKEAEPSKKRTGRRKQLDFVSKPSIDFSVKLSKITSNVRIRDLKNALIERGVKPSDITWRGHQGFCYLHFGKLRNENSQTDQPVQVDSIIANLQELQIGELKNGKKKYMRVEPVEPITRIEVTDVTSV